ncbi:MAG: hypothetical protein EOO88_55265 [Pedobacter sp.]|nr:MAG: hypothetical protein EOO88_55265 [Pedobacter sp.]
MDALELGSFSVDGKCQGCIVEASLSEIRLIIKEFSELPVAPDGQTTFGISTPGRFSGLITRSHKIILQGTVQGQSTARAVVTTSLPASYTTVSPWCSSFIETAGSNCRISVKGVATDTYFKFVNVTPTDLTQTPTKLMGGSEGIANAFVSMDLAVVIKRDGVEIEKKSITLDSPLVQVYNASLPDWAGNLLRNALLSGAPEFDDSTSL